LICVIFFCESNNAFLQSYYLGGSRKTKKVGGERDETSTKEKGTKNETTKSKVYVKDDMGFYFSFSYF